MAYASLVCLTNTLDENIRLNLIPENSLHIQTLIKEAIFFRDFLEKSSNKSNEIAKYLESRIRDTTYRALDIIDSHVANGLDASKESEVDMDEGLFKDLDEVMKAIISIKHEATQIREEEDNKEEPDIQPAVPAPAGTSRPPSQGMTTNTMVGLDDQLKEIKTRLVSDSSQCEIVALVGMGGIGKTTLARKVYDDKFIISRFDTRRWVTVSQEYSMQSIIAGLLGRERMSPENNENLKLDLYQSLKNRRYLIVLDDMWDTKIWEGLKQVLPDDDNESRILLTTRLEQVAKHENSSPPEYMRFLDDRESWGLFCEVFGRDCCPPELEKAGKEIVKNCRGLPLAIKVIGGHLSKATRTPQYWRSVAKNLSETIASEDDEQCSRVLSLSYKHLPHPLKGCFLYMSIFPEDCIIKVPLLLNLWIANGLIKQETPKSSKDIAKEYFLDLVERNLILVSERKYNGKILKCRIHDLIRDLCVKEAKDEKFFHITNKSFCHDYFCGVDHVRVAIHPGGLRAFYCYSWGLKDIPTMAKNQANLRYLYQYPSSNGGIPFHKLVHLHTIHAIHSDYSRLNIWEMPQLRHVNTSRMVLPDPPPSEIEGENSLIVLEKLETLTRAQFFTFTDEVLRRIPNLKKLAISYFQMVNDVYHYPVAEEAIDWRQFRLNNLERLHKLESLECHFAAFNMCTPVLLGRDITFPHSIKKLTLAYCRSPWEDMTVVGSLPNLQVLKLDTESFTGKEWEPNEGEFLNLKTLFLQMLDLVHWRAEAVHFPMLQHLFITRCTNLLEIPSGVGEIPTLELIKINTCRTSVEASAREIEEEQHSFGNEGLRVVIRIIIITTKMKSCSSNSMKVDSFTDSCPYSSLSRLINLLLLRMHNEKTLQNWTLKN